MSIADIVNYAARALVLVLMLSMPSIVAAAVIGTLVSLLQAVTQIQDQTLGFAFKLVAVLAVIYMTARWLGSELYHYTISIMDSIWMIGS